MTVVSTEEFISNGEKYFDIASKEEQIYIKGGDCMFIITKMNEPMRKYKKPDDDLRRAIPMEQVRDSVIAHIRKKHVQNV